MSYTKTTWVDSSPPAVSAANLNKIEAGIYNAQAHIGKRGFVDPVSATYVASKQLQISGTPTDDLGNKKYRVGDRVLVHLETSNVYRWATISAVAEATDTTLTLIGVVDSGENTAALLNEDLTVFRSVIGAGLARTSAPHNSIVLAAIPDNFITSRNTEVLEALLLAGALHMDLYIPRGVKWGYDEIPFGEASTIQAQHPDEVTIYDDSGWDWVWDDATSVRKIIQKTVDPGSKNAHEWALLAAWNPGVIVDVVSGATDPEIAADPSKARCSIVLRRDGVSKWQFKLDPGTDGSQKDNLSIARYPDSGGQSLMVASLDDGRVSWNGGSLISTGVAWNFASKVVGTAIIRWVADSDSGLSIQYRNDISGQLYREDVAADGERTLYNTANAIVAKITENHEISGLKVKTDAKTTTYAIDNSVGKPESGKWFTNEGASAGFIVTLPSATKGQSYKFFVVAAENFQVDTSGADVFRGLAGTIEKQSSTPGSWLEVYCVVAGIWEFRAVGTWADV